MSEIEDKGLAKHKRSFVLTEKTCRYAGAVFLTLGMIGLLAFGLIYYQFHKIPLSGSAEGYEWFTTFIMLGQFSSFIAIILSMGFNVLGVIFYILSFAFTTLFKVVEEIELTI